MKKILAFIISFIVVLGAVLGIAYFFFADQLFLPWTQQPDYTFINDSVTLEDDEDFEIDPTVKGGLEEQIQAKEVDVPLEELPSIQRDEDRELETIVANYYGQLQKPRLMEMSPYGDILVSDIEADAVYAIVDEDGDYRGDRKVTIIENLNNPHGLAMYNGDLYIAETNKVRVLRNLHEGYGYDRNEVIIDELTDGSGHFTRTIRIHDNKIYLSVGSSCNACIEQNENRATVLRYDLDGSNKEVWARGLRNTVGFVVSPFDQELYGVNNGRDWLGDNLPPEELNRLQAGHFGWPYCYGNQVRDNDVAGDFDCSTTVEPVYTMQAHTAPLGLRFYNGDMFSEFFGDLLVAQHGSWNSTVPVGYKVIGINFEDSQPVDQYDVLDIFMQGDNVRGRPVDVLVGNKGEIYITDDFAGRIYVMYKQ